MKKHGQAISRHPIIRIIVIGIFEMLGLLLMAWLLDGLSIARLGAAIWAVIVIGLLNALLWPILSRIILPFAVFTGGLFFLVLNGFILWLASEIVPGFEVDRVFWTAIWASIGITAINVILSTLLTIDDDGSYYRNVIRRRMRRRGEVLESDVPGVFFLEIDGLARPVLDKAITQGYAPTMKRWLEEGSHSLVTWETDTSSQTSASQAGILHGNNDNIPAFRWYDRDRQVIVASSNPGEVAILEKERSNGQGLLVNDGASRGNLMSGDAPNVMNTASVIKDFSRFHPSEFYAYFSSPYNFTRTLLLVFWDVVLDRYRFWLDRRNDVIPRLDKHHRNYIYSLVRAGTTVLLRELNIYTLIGDMYAGRSSAYATFVGYDEVAHHSGVESTDAYDALFKIDQQFARMESAAQRAPRPYHFVILSDHGQSGGQTFKQRYGKTLEDLVQELAKEHIVFGFEESPEGYAHVNAFLTEAIQHQTGTASRGLNRALRSRTEDGNVNVGPQVDTLELAELDPDRDGLDIHGEKIPGIVVVASGNLGLVYGTRRTTRATVEEIEALFPGLLEGLAAHEGIGFIMVGSARGPVVMGKGGRCYLAEDLIEGENPLADFGPRAAEHLIREDSFPNCPDILVNSFYNAETNEVAAFEELIGCHGGLGGYQTQPFILYPSEWQLDQDEIIGAENVYKQLKGWLGQYEQAEAAG